MDCHVYRINCIEDHLHLLVGLPSTIDLSTFVKRFKLSTGRWLTENPAYPHFERWQEKYGAFSVSWKDKEVVIEYIKNQEEHHRSESTHDEFVRLLKEYGMEYNPKDEI